MEPSSEVSSCSPSAGKVGRVAGGGGGCCEGWMRELQQGTGGGSRGKTAGVSRMRGWMDLG